MSEEGQPYFDYVTMFSFSGTILLMGMRTRDKMRYPYLGKEGVKGFIFTSPVGLHSKNFSVK
jgi:hypothetical protein